MICNDLTVGLIIGMFMLIAFVFYQAFQIRKLNHSQQENSKSLKAFNYNLSPADISQKKGDRKNE